MGRMTLCHYEAAVPFVTWSHAGLTATMYLESRCLVHALHNQVGLLRASWTSNILNPDIIAGVQISYV